MLAVDFVLLIVPSFPTTPVSSKPGAFASVTVYVMPAGNPAAAALPPPLRTTVATPSVNVMPP